MCLSILEHYDYFNMVAAIHCFTISPFDYIVYDGAKREGIPRNGMSEQGYHDPLRRAVPDKVTLDTDGFTDKSVVEVVEYTFTDYTK